MMSFLRSQVTLDIGAPVNSQGIVRWEPSVMTYMSCRRETTGISVKHTTFLTISFVYMHSYTYNMNLKIQSSHGDITIINLSLI